MDFSLEVMEKKQLSNTLFSDKFRTEEVYIPLVQANMAKSLGKVFVEAGARK
jgi:hypothetical protein